MSRRVNNAIEEALSVLSYDGDIKEVPLCLPDGSDFATVEQVAVMIGESEKVTAWYVLGTKGLPVDLYRQAKALVSTPESFKDGIAIMLQPSLAEAEQIAMYGGADASELHVTLGYFGSDPAKVSESELKELCEYLTQDLKPMVVDLNGITRFSVDEPDGLEPLVVNVDSRELEDARISFLSAVKFKDLTKNLYRNHGFSPHMTLGMVQTDAPMPIQRWMPRKCTLRDLVLGYGTKYTYWDLSSGNNYTKDVHTGSVEPTSNAGFGRTRKRRNKIVDRAGAMRNRIRPKKKPMERDW